MFTNTPIGTPASWMQPGDYYYGSKEPAKTATEETVELHVVFSDGSEDWYLVGDPQDSATLTQHISDALEQGQTWTCTRIVSSN